jgi:hypothetical protein
LPDLHWLRAQVLKTVIVSSVGETISTANSMLFSPVLNPEPLSGGSGGGVDHVHQNQIATRAFDRVVKNFGLGSA